MKHMNAMQKYLSNLAVLNVKFHNIHWNVVGMNFVQIHNFTEEVYDSFFEQFDEVAELLKMKNITPFSTIFDYVAHATVVEVPAKPFSIKESLEIVLADIQLMKNLAIEIRNEADKENDFETVAVFEGYVAGYSKNIWFLNAMLKA